MKLMDTLRANLKFVLNPAAWQLRSKHYALQFLATTIIVGVFMAITVTVFGLMGLSTFTVVRGMVITVALATVVTLALIGTSATVKFLSELATRKREAENSKAQAESDTARSLANKVASEECLAQRKLAADVNAEKLVALVVSAKGLFALKKELPLYGKLFVRFSNRDEKVTSLNPDQFVAYLNATSSAGEKLPAEVTWFVREDHGDKYYITCTGE